MKTLPEVTGARALLTTALKAALGLALCASCTAQAATFTWSSGSSWTKGSNWVNGNAPGTTDIAEFDSAPSSGSSHGVGPTFVATSVNNTTYTGADGGPLPDQGIGAISLTAARNSVGSLYVGSTASSGSSGGYMTFYGATVGGVANTVMSDLSTQNLHFQNDVGTGFGVCGMVLGNTANIFQTVGGASSSAVPTIEIDSTIDQVSAGSSITLLGGGSSTLLGGILDLTGTNSFTGGITIGKSDGTQGGTVQIDAVASLPTTGNIVVNNNSELLLNANGTFGGLGQSLTLAGQGIASALSGGVSGALRASGTLTWQGNVNIGSNVYITPTSTNILTLSGTITDNGNILQKQGSGTLILTNANNNMTGSTNIGNGTLTVNAGSSMGSGDLAMAQSSTNNTALNLNEATQSIGNLSSSFAATTGTETQIITLNSTALTINETLSTTFGLGVVSSTVSQTSTIVGSGSVILGAASTGALTLTGSQGYTGGTQIKAGSLYVNGTLNGTTGTVNMTGGTLAGSGVIGGQVTAGSGATITTGSAAGAIGALTLQTGLNLSSGGTYAWTLGTFKDDSNGTAGTDFDQLSLTGGALTLGGSSKLTLAFLTDSPNSADTFWQTDHTWTIISATGATGSGNFSSITDPTYANGTFSTSANSSGDVTLSYQTVPEPSALVSVGLGAAALLAIRRKRR